MARNKNTKLHVEVLEDRSCPSTSGGLMAFDVGPIAAFKDTPITIPVLTNDVSNNGGSLSVLSITQGLNGVAALNADNTAVIFTPNPGATGSDSLGLSITDGTDTATANLFINIAPSPGELYSTYQLAVSQADQVYANAIQAAQTTAQTALNSNALSTQVAADQLYSIYTVAVSSALQTYQDADQAALTQFDGAITQADAVMTGRINAAEGVIQSATVSAQSVMNQALSAADTQYQQAIQQADGAFQGVVASSQAQLDAAQANAQANPDDPSARAALAQAQQDYLDAITQATTIHDAAYSNALGVQQSAYDSANQTYQAAVAAVVAVEQPEIDAALQDDAQAREVAFATALSADVAARQVYTQAEASAWGVYQTGLDSLIAQNAANEASIQLQYDAAVGSALLNWQASVTAALNTYTNAMGAQPGQLPVPRASFVSSTTGPAYLTVAQVGGPAPPRLRDAAVAYGSYDYGHRYRGHSDPGPAT